jgi:hypothetical protein
MRDFHYTVNVLVKAYLNDTLEHSNCGACAVGNMIADSIGDANFPVHSPFIDKNVILSKGHGWAAVFCTVSKDKQFIFSDEYNGVAKEQIDSTGYTWQELARIEKAFEYQGYTIKGRDEAMFCGLMAVVDVLADIHNIDLKVREEVKTLFVKN